MISSSIQDSFAYNFPLSEEGVTEGCQKLKECIENTKSLTKVKVCLVFESTIKSEYEFSATLEREVFSNKLTFNSLKGNKTETIKKFVEDMGIKLNQVRSNERVKRASGGGIIVSGNSTEFVAIKGGVASYRALFPGMSDEEIKKLMKL